YGGTQTAVIQVAASDYPDQNTNEKPVLFTDIVDIVVNNFGVVMHFMQNGGAGGQPATVAKVGMSREHAKSVLQILQATLMQTEKGLPRLPKKLIAPDNSKPDELRNN